jgi:hypothetical protein
MSSSEAGARAWWPAIWVAVTLVGGLAMTAIDAKQRATRA